MSERDDLLDRGADLIEMVVDLNRKLRAMTRERDRFRAALNRIWCGEPPAQAIAGQALRGEEG